MLDDVNSIVRTLAKLNLKSDEAKIYLELLREPRTHWHLSRITGINRTRIYRLVENLEKKSLVSRRTDDQGTFLIASDPASLDVALVSQEEKVKAQRDLLKNLLPSLQAITGNNKRAFAVQTYEGIEGLKQMCWHELKTKGELLVLGGPTIEDLISNHRWAEKQRSLSAEIGYSIRVIVNQDVEVPKFTNNKTFMQRYQYRQMPNKQISFNEQTVIYNDTVAIYHWKNQKVGIEVMSKTYAAMMRAMFESFWESAVTP